MSQGRAFAVALALALAAPFGSFAMTTPALLEPAALAGTWTLTGPRGKACRLVLRAAPAADGGGFAVEIADCAGWGGPIGQVSNWRTSSDGFGLATADGSTALFFSNEGEGLFAARSRDGKRYELRRAR